MVARNSLPPSWQGKTVSQHWVSILLCWKKQSWACSLWAWSYLKSLPLLYCVGMGWLWRTLFWQPSARCMGVLIFTYPAARFVSFTSQIFFSLWSKRDRASCFILLLGFRPWRIYDHWVWFKVRENSSSISPLQEMIFQLEPDPGERGKVTQSVSRQNLKLPSSEEDNFCDNNLRVSNPVRQLVTRDSWWTRPTESGRRAGSELTLHLPKWNHWYF